MAINRLIVAALDITSLLAAALCSLTTVNLTDAPILGTCHLIIIGKNVSEFSLKDKENNVLNIVKNFQNCSSIFNLQHNTI